MYVPLEAPGWPAVVALGVVAFALGYASCCLQDLRDAEERERKDQ